MENNSQNMNAKIVKKYGWNSLNLMLALLSAFIILVLGSSATLIFKFTLHEVKVMAFWLIAFYALLMLFLAIRRTLKEIIKTQIKTHFIEKIVEKPVVERVVVHEPGKVRTITKIVNKVKTIKQKSKKLNIPHFKFVGSSVSKRYHTHACRLGKLIKNKFKVHHNTKAFFIKRKFKPCKVCILKEKKI